MHMIADAAEIEDNRILAIAAIRPFSLKIISRPPYSRSAQDMEGRWACVIAIRQRGPPRFGLISARPSAAGSSSIQQGIWFLSAWPAQTTFSSHDWGHIPRREIPNIGRRPESRHPRACPSLGFGDAVLCSTKVCFDAASAGRKSPRARRRGAFVSGPTGGSQPAR